MRVDSIAKVAEIEEAEKAKMKAKVEKLLAHHMNVFISRQLIYNYPEQLLTDAGVGSIEHADFEGIERLAAVLGGERARGDQSQATSSPPSIVPSPYVWASATASTR